MSIAAFALFVLLVVTAGVAGWRGWVEWMRFSRSRLGGPEENTDLMRRAFRSWALSALILAVSLIGAAVVQAGSGWRWRNTIYGEIVLTGLVLLAAGWVVWASGYTVRQQWSREGSVGGMVRGMLHSVFALLTLALFMSWRFG